MTTAQNENSAAVGQSGSNALLDLRRNTERTVDDIPNSELLERAVRHAVLNRGRRMAWVAVMDMLALGSTFSMQLCRRYGIDPERGYKSNADLDGTKGCG